MLLEPTRKPSSSPRTLEHLSTPPSFPPTLFDDNTLPTTIPLGLDQNFLDLGFDHHDFNSYPQSFNSSRSPSLTHSAFTEYSPIQGSLATFDSNPTTASPRGTGSFTYTSQRGLPTLDETTAELFPNTDNMPSDWSAPNHTLLTPRTATQNHHRGSSLSSLGSNGPPSPFSSNQTNPYIASAESATDCVHDFSEHFQLAKSYSQPGAQNMHYPMYTSATNSNGAGYHPRSSAPPMPKLNRALHAQGPLIGSGTVSVASSIGPDSPSTPVEDLEDARRRQNGEDSDPFRIWSRDPSLPIFHDAVASNLPNMMLVPPPPSNENEVFNQTLRAAHNRLSATPMTTGSRARSPFQNSSHLAQMPQNFSGFGPAQDMGAQHQMHSVNTSTPPTISPKELYDHFDHSDTFTSLFPGQSSMDMNMDAVSKSMSSQHMPSMGGLPLSNFLAQYPSGLQIPSTETYHFPTTHHSGVPSLGSSLAPSRLGSAETGMGALSQSNSPQRPTSATANSGTYSCTYHGCTQRFATAQLLQKHKKDSHRGGARRAESVAPGELALMDNQTGPHRCERINPSTGKPCNRDFSRPYDLTRHESTVHDPEKKKARCGLCADEKTFSRGDALVRHYHVCHPDADVPGKQRRRTGDRNR